MANHTEVPQSLDLSEAGPLHVTLPAPLRGDILDRDNQSARRFKRHLNELTGGILHANQLGQFAVGLVFGRIRRGNRPDPEGLYEVTEDGRRIVLKDPNTLYNRWPLEEDKVGPALQDAMRRLTWRALAEHEAANN
jgi:hypothetical protein